MNARELKVRLAAGKTVFGSMLCVTNSMQWSQVLAHSSLDFAVIDTEHSSRDREQIASLAFLCKSVGIATIIRVAVPEPHYVAMALDAGADGVLVPYCETVEDVRACVAVAKLHPLKGEYLRRAVEEGVFPSDKSRDYLTRMHRDHLIIIGIESEPAVGRLDEFLAVGDIDGLFIGPNDMTTSLGIPDEVTHPTYINVLKEVIGKAEAAAVPVMIHHVTTDSSKRAIALGARFVLHGTDTTMLLQAMQDDFREIRSAARQLRGEPIEDQAAGGLDAV